MERRNRRFRRLNSTCTQAVGFHLPLTQIRSAVRHDSRPPATDAEFRDHITPKSSRGDAEIRGSNDAQIRDHSHRTVPRTIRLLAYREEADGLGASLGWQRFEHPDCQPQFHRALLIQPGQ